MIWSVPLDLLPSYSDRDVVVRDSDPDSLARVLLDGDSDCIKGVQLVSPGHEVGAFRGLPPSMPIDLCMTELRQRSGISRWSEVFRDRGVRLVVPAINGFSHVVKEALRANLRVGLEIDQSEAVLVLELVTRVQVSFWRGHQMQLVLSR